jgi:hypothetical protein
MNPAELARRSNRDEQMMACRLGSLAGEINDREMVAVFVEFSEMADHLVTASGNLSGLCR